MNIQIFGTTKCFDTKKAQRYFKERGIKFQMIDLKEKGMSRGEFDNVARALGGWEKMVNPNAKDKQTRCLEDLGITTRFHKKSTVRVLHLRADCGILWSAENLHSWRRYPMKNYMTPEEHARLHRRRARQALGLLVAVLVLIGAVTVLRSGVRAVAKLFDDTAQKEEYEDKLEGLVLFDPLPFDGIENIDDLTLREAAVWGCVYNIPALR